MKFSLSAIATLFSCVTLHATVTINSVIPSLPSPQPVGTPITFNVTATDSNAGPLTFQFSTAFGNGSFGVVRNFNVGTSSAGVWNAQPFSWANISSEGAYTIQIVAKDFATGETAKQTVPFTLTSLVSGGTITVVPTQNALVALAAVPACPTGSSVRVYFSRPGVSAASTPFAPCLGTASNNFYVGGLYAGKTYSMGYQIKKGSTYVNGGSTAMFTAGSLPTSISFPIQNIVVPPTSQSYKTDKVVLHGYLNLGAGPGNYQPAATDQSGSFTWYYDGGNDHQVLLARPLSGGVFLFLQSGLTWNTSITQSAQLMREVDLAGNVLRETNVGLLQQQLFAMGATDLQSCSNVSLPAAVGSACLTALSHDIIQLPNGYFAFIASAEKIFPPGTQGNQTGLNVDIVGDAIIVVDNNLNAVWYMDTFQHDGGGNQLDINRAAILHETCAQGQGGCPLLNLAGTSGVTPIANDWLHCNSLQYRSSDGNFILSSRHQDWVMKINYQNGAGDGRILWRMGVAGDFTFNNINNDSYPWFSHQHDAGFETNGEFTVYDNGNTRVSTLGTGNSRGMALTVDENAMSVTPVLSQDLGVYAFALGSSQLLANGNYHFQPGIVAPNSTNYSIELLPTAGTTSATQVFNQESGTSSYRSFRMANLYTAPVK